MAGRRKFPPNSTGMSYKHLPQAARCADPTQKHKLSSPALDQMEKLRVTGNVLNFIMGNVADESSTQPPVSHNGLYISAKKNRLVTLCLQKAYTHGERSPLVGFFLFSKHARANDAYPNSAKELGELW